MYCIFFFISIIVMTPKVESISGKFLLVEMFLNVVWLKSDPRKDWISNL